MVPKERFGSASRVRAAFLHLRGEVPGVVACSAVALKQETPIPDGRFPSDGLCRYRCRLWRIAHEPRKCCGIQHESSAKQQRHASYCHMSHERYTTWNRSVSIEPLETPKLRSVVSTAFIIGDGPQMRKAYRWNCLGR